MTDLDLSEESRIWLGQNRRRRAFRVIGGIIEEIAPIDIEKGTSIVSFKTGLTRRKIQADYIRVLSDCGVIEHNSDGMLRKGPNFKELEKLKKYKDEDEGD